MNNLPKYVIIRSKVDGLPPMILQTEYPCMVGNIITLVPEHKQEDRETFMRSIADRSRPVAKVKDYSIFILPKCTLSGERVPTEEAFTILNEMARYFEREETEQHPVKWGAYVEDRQALAKRMDGIKRRARIIKARRVTEEGQGE